MTAQTGVREEGALVRLVRDAAEGEVTVHGLRVGDEFRVSDYLPEADDGGEMVYGDHRGGCNNVSAPPAALELVMSAAEMAARRLPSPEEVTRALDLHGNDHGDVLVNVDESWPDTLPDGTPVLAVVGRAGNGLRMVAYVAVLRVEQADE